MERVVAEDEDQRRFAIGLPGFYISYSQAASASMAARVDGGWPLVG